MTPDILIDTDVFSFLFRRDSRAASYTAHVDEKYPALSFMTVAEVYHWTISRHWGPTRVGEVLKNIELYTVLREDDETAWHWARVTTIPGYPVNTADAWIAATALRHHLPIVAHNRRHFERIPNLRVISEAP